MANIILDYTSCLSCNIGSITFTSSNSSESFELVYVGESDVTVYSCSLDFVSGFCTLNCLRGIIEKFMFAKGLIFGTFRLRLGNMARNLDVQYCSLKIPDTFDLSDRFYSLLEVQRIDINSKVSVCCDGTNLLRFEGLFLVDGQTIKRNWFTDVTFSNPHNAVYDVADIISNLRSNVIGADIVPLWIRAICGDRSKVWFIYDEVPDIRLYFRNCFNCLEIMPLCALVKESLEVKHSDAMAEGVFVQYDLAVTKSYEITTEILSDAEYIALEQALCSSNVFIDAGFGVGKVLVLDSTVDRSSDPDEVVVAKFKIRFADPSPMGNVALLDFISRNSSIFTNEFTREFA